MTLSQQRRRVAAWLVILAAGLSLLGWIAFLLLASTNLALLADASDSFLRLLQALGVVAVLGLVLVLWNLIEILRRRDVNAWVKVGHSLITFACAGAVWFILRFDLLRMQLNY